MNPFPTSPAVRRLAALSVSRTRCGGAVRPTRLAGIRPAAATITTTAQVMSMKYPRHQRKLAILQGKEPGPKKPTKKPVTPPHPINEDHGEVIWIHNHTYDGHVLISFDRVMDDKDRLRQMPYTGKKLVPAKLRKDYWQPMAMIRFGTGLGEVGRSVYQKLRELKKRHELEWGRDDPEEEQRMLNMSRHERGKAINDQRANVVADMAAVLGGYGKGNRMWMMPWTEEWEKKGVQIKKSPTRDLVPLREKGLLQVERWRLEKMGVQVQTAGGLEPVDKKRLHRMRAHVGTATESEKFVDFKSLMDHFVDIPPAVGEEEMSLYEARQMLERHKALHKVRVYWHHNNLQYRDYAESWTDNVKHMNHLGERRSPKGFVAGVEELVKKKFRVEQKAEEPVVVEEPVEGRVAA
ncbi:transcriptional regulation of mitochondrial recombination-domain-containing protein [Podospora conica]|nr:transcriptional regulation of mitochondrial recombination-domain-containing protein [Schizothecium conicum]